LFGPDEPVVSFRAEEAVPENRKDRRERLLGSLRGTSAWRAGALRLDPAGNFRFADFLFRIAPRRTVMCLRSFGFLLLLSVLAFPLSAQDTAGPAVVPVQSKVIEHFTYDETTRQLTVNFKEGGRRLHFGVPPEVVERLAASAHPGGYYRSHIDRVYRSNVNLKVGSVEMIPVESKIFDAVAYDTQQRRLLLLDDEGGVTEFQDVPEDLFSGFLASPFKGGFFNSRIRNRFESRRVEVAAPDAPAEPASAPESADALGDTPGPAPAEPAPAPAPVPVAAAPMPAAEGTESVPAPVAEAPAPAPVAEPPPAPAEPAPAPVPVAEAPMPAAGGTEPVPAPVAEAPVPVPAPPVADAPVADPIPAPAPAADPAPAPAEPAPVPDPAPMPKLTAEEAPLITTDELDRLLKEVGLDPAIVKDPPAPANPVPMVDPAPPAVAPAPEPAPADPPAPAPVVDVPTVPDAEPSAPKPEEAIALPPPVPAEVPSVPADAPAPMPVPPVADAPPPPAEPAPVLAKPVPVRSADAPVAVPQPVVAEAKPASPGKTAAPMKDKPAPLPPGKNGGFYDPDVDFEFKNIR
jgi:hypothetical protein